MCRGNRKHPYRPRDVFQVALAEIGERRIGLVAHGFVGEGRKANPARRGDAFEPRRDVDAVAHQVAVVFLDDIAQMNADAELDLPVDRDACVALGHAGLHLDRAAHGIDHAAELDQRAVAGALHHAAMVGRDGGIDQVAAQGAQPRQGAFFLGAGEPAVADHVRRQDRRQFARAAHSRPRSGIMPYAHGSGKIGASRESNMADEKKRLEGKVAIVTGAGSRADGIGNGRAASILMARNGAKVALVDANRANAEATARMIGNDGESFVVEADVTDQATCQRIVADTVKRWGKLDILVNNVGIDGPRGNAVDIDMDGWDRAMAINVKSMVMMAKYAIPEMKKAGGGAIVNLASVAGLRGGNPNIFYTTSKGAIVQMTRAMAAHHGRDGIRVNCIAPGMVYTPMVYAAGMTPEVRDARRRRSLLQTEGTGWDIGNGVLYLVSDEARWVTGVILPVDAGATAGGGAMPEPRPLG